MIVLPVQERGIAILRNLNIMLSYYYKCVFIINDMAGSSGLHLSSFCPYIYIHTAREAKLSRLEGLLYRGMITNEIVE